MTTGVAMDASIESLCALPLRKRIEIVEALMVSIEREAGPDVWPISDEVIEESLRELEAHDADPSSSIPWETVRAELMKKYG